MLFDYLVEYNRYLNISAILLILSLAYAFSLNRRAIWWRQIGMALILQFLLGFFMLKTSVGVAGIQRVALLVAQLYQAAEVGSSFIFGSLINPAGPWGFVFGFKVLPIIIFFGAFMSLLFHWGLVQPVVRAISILVQPLLGTSGAETVCAIANSFLGQTEAPLLVRHYLGTMTKSEMMVVMVSGMGTISGSILVVFAAMGIPTVHLLTASIMAIPGTLLIAKILCPETERPETAAGASVINEPTAQAHVFDALAQGTTDGLFLALNVGAMLIAFLALIALGNTMLGHIGVIINMAATSLGFTACVPPLSLALIFSYLFYPFAYVLGFVGSEALAVAQLLGTKIAINELVAYTQLIQAQLSDRTVAIVTYALCGFSNFSCIGIQLGGIGSLVPAKRSWISEFGLRAVLGGALANLLSAALVGLLL